MTTDYSEPVSKTWTPEQLESLGQLQELLAEKWREWLLEKSAAICGACQKKVTTTFEYRGMGLVAPRPTSIPNILVSTCDDCGSTVGIPSQSTPEIAEKRTPRN